MVGGSVEWSDAAVMADHDGSDRAGRLRDSGAILCGGCRPQHDEPGAVDMGTLKASQGHGARSLGPLAARPILLVGSSLLIDVDSSEVVVPGLSMLHSPCLHNGQPRLLNARTGEFGHIDTTAERFGPWPSCPAWPAAGRSSAPAPLPDDTVKIAWQNLPCPHTVSLRATSPRMWRARRCLTEFVQGGTSAFTSFHNRRNGRRRGHRFIRLGAGPVGG